MGEEHMGMFSHTRYIMLYHVKCVLSSQHSTTVPLCWILIHTSHTYTHTHTLYLNIHTQDVWDPGVALPFSFPI